LKKLIFISPQFSLFDARMNWPHLFWLVKKCFLFLSLTINSASCFRLSVQFLISSLPKHPYLWTQPTLLHREQCGIFHQSLVNLGIVIASKQTWVLCSNTFPVILKKKSAVGTRTTKQFNDVVSCFNTLELILVKAKFWVRTLIWRFINNAYRLTSIFSNSLT